MLLAGDALFGRHPLTGRAGPARAAGALHARPRRGPPGHPAPGRARAAGDHSSATGPRWATPPPCRPSPPRSRRDAALGARRRGRAATVALLHGVMALAETWWRIGPALAARGLARGGGRPAGARRATSAATARSTSTRSSTGVARASRTARSTCWSATASARSSRSGCSRATRARRARWCSRSRPGPGAIDLGALAAVDRARRRGGAAATARRSSRASARPTRAGTRATSSARCAASRRPTATRSSPR